MSAPQPTEATKLLSSGALAHRVDLESSDVAHSKQTPAQPVAEVTQKPATPSIHGIEGLRSLCCILILSMHYQDKVGKHDDANLSPDAATMDLFFWAVLTRDANFTVDVYFIVAGFVGELGSKSQHSWKFSECRKVLLKKFIRLAPIYYTCTLLWLALHYYSVPCHVHTLTVVLHLFMVQAWPVFDGRAKVQSHHLFVGYHSNKEEIHAVYGQDECPATTTVTDPAEVNDSTWFVSCLVGCYVIHVLAAPILFSKTATGSATRCAFLSLLFACARAMQYDRGGQTPGWPIMWMSKWPPCAYCAFAAGGYAARLVQQLPTRVLDSRAWIFMDSALLALWGKALYATSIEDPENLTDHFDWLDATQPLICVFLVAACATNKGIVLQYLSHPALVSLGPISYATYCVQGPVFDFMGGMNFNFKLYHVVITFFFLVWTLGGVITKYIDNPMRNFLMKRCLAS